MRFPYYRRLDGEQKATYRASDRVRGIELPSPADLRPIAAAIADALGADDRVEVEKLTQRIVSGICRQLEVPVGGVRVLAVRPRERMGELHGLYVRTEGERPVLIVWMRTAARARPVAPRTYLRTLFHEVCHHLDYELLRLDDSFHTHGFFQRESSLVRQLVRKRAPKKKAPELTPRQQLELFLERVRAS